MLTWHLLASPCSMHARCGWLSGSYHARVRTPRTELDWIPHCSSSARIPFFDPPFLITFTWSHCIKEIHDPRNFFLCSRGCARSAVGFKAYQPIYSLILRGTSCSSIQSGSASTAPPGPTSDKPPDGITSAKKAGGMPNSMQKSEGMIAGHR